MFNRYQAKWLCLLIIILMYIPVGMLNASAATNITDIKGHWAEADIEEWLEQGVVTGYPDQTFQPERNVTRGEFVALVNRAFQFSETQPITFTDVNSTDWVYREVQKAVARGYIDGFSDNSFRSDQSITRQETSVMISRILRLESKDAKAVKLGKDSDSIASWGQAAISNLLDNGIMSLDIEEMFHPNRSITRAESLVSLKRALSWSRVVYDKSGNYGEDTLKIEPKDVIISAPGVTLMNMHILGDLVISKEVGDGEAYLDKVQVDGVTRIEGGGKNSIHIQDSQLGTLSVNRLKQAVRIVAEGITVIRDAQVLSSAILEEHEIKGEGFIQLTILPEPSGGQSRSISVSGDFQSIRLNADIQELQILTGNIENLYIAEELKNPTIVLNKDASIQTLDAKSKSKISGEGTIHHVNLSDDAKGSVLPEAKPSFPIFGGGGFPSGGGGGPSGGGGNASTAVTSITATSGTIKVLFNSSLVSLPSATDFVVTRKRNNGASENVNILSVHFMERQNEVLLTVPPVEYGDVEQSVIYSISYKNVSTVSSPAFTVSKRNVTVSGALYYWKYGAPKALPLYNVYVNLTGIQNTEGSYESVTDQRGKFVFTNVLPGTYIANIYLGPIRYYTRDFVVEAGKAFTLPDLIIEEEGPEASVTNIVYSDLGYISGSVMNLDEPYSVKVELENGTLLQGPSNKYEMFFGYNLFDYNPGLVLNHEDKLFVTMFTNTWNSDRFEVNVMERPKTKSPTGINVIYEDTKYIRGTVEDWSNAITVVKEDGTVIGNSHNNLGNSFEVYLTGNEPLPVGESLSVYVQAEGKRKSDPVRITVVAPTEVTATPSLDKELLEGSTVITGKAAAESDIIVKRSDGFILGQDRSGPTTNSGRFNVNLSSATIVGETLYVYADGYEKRISAPLTVQVGARPVTPAPVLAGEIFSDFTSIRASVTPIPNSWITVYLKNGNGTVIKEIIAAADGNVTFWYPELASNTQYQLTAKAAEMKESVPVFFTPKEPTEVTPVPTVSETVYADAGYRVHGMTEPNATIRLYYENGTPAGLSQADSMGQFYFIVPIDPPVLPGDKLLLRADLEGKLMSEPLVVTTIALVEKSSQPVIQGGGLYGYTSRLSGTATPGTLIQAYHEDGRQIYTGVYSDATTGNWSILLVYTLLQAGDRIYVTADEVGKLPSDPVYLTVQPSPKSVTPTVTSSTVTSQSTMIQGTYSGARIVNSQITAIFLVNEQGNVDGFTWLESNGTFTMSLSPEKLVPGDTIKIYAREGDKGLSDPVVINING
ncbi:S-layer homology domain-containing protein [Paenibacillus qinlingensis]|uniref:S-layer homology domain-containing protein n=1 Tax=Paenibacillus qinlingensis TaxID=1837343 RepID=UPI001565D534|nr:S-layer homology domain-containing protein [Paenibacillus qinlingensis]NQX63730.1 S-layer homology domain-containing protein [Paenibacillus qinlingensis]